MKASILINNYNYDKYLDECLLSVFNQSYNNIEIIVFDDASTDESINILKSYSQKIILLVNEDEKSNNNSHNQFNAIKRAFQKSTGDIIFLLDSDDFFLKTKVERIMNLYKLNPETKSIQDSITILRNNKKNKPSKYLTSNKKFNPLDFVTKLNLVIKLGPQTSGMSFRRNYFQDLIDKYNYNVPLIWPDIQLGRLALFENNAMVIDESYTIRRIHGLSDSLKLNKNNVMTDFLIQYSEWFNSRFNTNIDLNYKNKNKHFLKIKIVLYFIKTLNFKAIQNFLQHIFNRQL